MRIKLSKADANFIAEAIRQEIFDNRAYMMESSTIRKIATISDSKLIEKYANVYTEGLEVIPVIMMFLVFVSGLAWQLYAVVKNIIHAPEVFKSIKIHFKDPQKATTLVARADDLEKENQQLRAEINGLKSEGDKANIGKLKSVVGKVINNYKNILAMKIDLLRKVKPDEVKIDGASFSKSSGILANVVIGLLGFALVVGVGWLSRMVITMVKKIVNFMKGMHKSDGKAAEAFANRAKSAAENLRKRAQAKKQQNQTTNK